MRLQIPQAKLSHDCWKMMVDLNCRSDEELEANCIRAVRSNLTLGN